MKESKKRGLSPVIASVLLIMLVMLLALIVFFWMRGFITERVEKFGKPIKDQCKLVDFEAGLVQGSGEYDSLEVINNGNININSLEIKIFKEGNSELKKFDIIIRTGDSLINEVSLRMSDGSYPNKIQVFPVLAGNVKGKETTRAFVCIDLGKTVYQDT